ncbi:hypothetical protein M2150_001812 [Lachnospiraceae bacterium PM6-15]|uniref:hypothetical protein n=1 Tax=Ohessyouella blattaphilus TaxID=2949333 RepID=UPI003E304DD5
MFYQLHVSRSVSYNLSGSVTNLANVKERYHEVKENFDLIYLVLNIGELLEGLKTDKRKCP